MSSCVPACRNTASSVSLAACMLELPLQELQQIRQLAEEGAGQVVLKLSGALLILEDFRPVIECRLT